MPFLLVLIGLFMPRLVLLVAAISTNWISTAYQSMVWPILGWFFVPLTTLVYILAMVYNDHAVTGGYAVLLGVAIFLDLFGHRILAGKSRDEG